MQIRQRNVNPAWYGMIVVVAVLIRWPMLRVPTDDLTFHVIGWLRHAEALGIGYLVRPFTDYSPFYDHALALMALFPGPEIYRLKLFSIVFEVVLAWSVTLLVDKDRKLAAFAAILFLPTIVANSALLGQTDALYTWLVVLSLAASLRRCPVWAMLALSLAIAVKLQALMFAPVLALLFLERRQPLWTFLLVPLGYVAVALPMMLAGRSLASVLGVYDAQFHYFQFLSAGAPNPWFFLGKTIPYRVGLAAGLPLAMLIVGTAVLLLWRTGIARTREGLLLAAAVLLVLAPYVTPKMHERYFYMADPVLLALALLRQRYLWPFLLAQTASFVSYPVLLMTLGYDDPFFGNGGFLQRHLHNGYGLMPAVGAVLMSGALALLVRGVVVLRREIRTAATTAPGQTSPIHPTAGAVRAAAAT